MVVAYHNLTMSQKHHFSEKVCEVCGVGFECNLALFAIITSELYSPLPYHTGGMVYIIILLYGTRVNDL